MTEIFAHRGSKGTHPENTLAAFLSSITLGVDGIELDVHLTKDQHLVVIHDETLERTTNGSGRVVDHTLAELKQLDASSWFSLYGPIERIPTLEEVLDLCSTQHFTGTLNIEVKTDQLEYEGIETILAATVARKFPFTIMYSSFNLLTLERLHQVDPERAKAWIMEGTSSTIDFASYFKAIDSIHPDINWYLTSARELVDFTKAIRPWTVNRESEMWMCFEQQVTAFHTDYPEQALALRTKFNQLMLVK